ncbi:MAG TPA: flagellar hook-associated protein FlgK [Rhizomicrobium sp.]|nr:flagellar hook-associated protein FlgK [Rhizomicrobium sp.]
MSLNGITASAISALQTNQAALNVVSNNVANLNTPGYARRVVNEQTLSADGQLTGVDIATVERVTNQFLQQEQLAAGGTASQYDTMATLFSQLNGLLGGPGDNQSLATQLTNVASAFATASQAPTSSASQTGVLNALNGLASSFSNVSSTISSLQNQVDQQVVNSVGSTNTLIQQVYQLNAQIKTANASGDQASALLDQRDTALNNLAQVMGIKTTTNADGSVNVSTTDGINLVSNTYAQLSYSGGAQNGSYSNITIQDVNPANGNLLGSPQALDPHLSSGSLKGMIDMRDQVLGGLGQSLGNLAQQTALAFNAQSNANAAFPPPTSLTGRDTGLLSTDALNFTGDTTIAVTDSSGNLVSRIDVDFGPPGTLSVDGGAAQSLGTTIGSFTTALNTALGANGSASFTNGQLSISASGGNGVVVQDDATTPSQRGDAGFSQFFGLNDVFQAQVPSITATGLSAADSSGLAAGGTIALSLKGPDGDIAKNVSITTTAGQTIGNVISALNTALGGAATLTLNSDGSISTANSALYPGYTLNVTGDTTQRGTTGVSFSELFGLGANAQAQQAAGFDLTTAVENNPALVGAGTPQITSTTVAGDTVVSAGDNSGAIALQNVINKSESFQAAGGIAAQTATLSDYAATFYQNLSTQSNAVTTNQTTQDDRLTEANSRVSSNSGVNLDEELTNLTSYQQAYAAGARILTTVDQLYQTLLQIQ